MTLTDFSLKKYSYLQLQCNFVPAAYAGQTKVKKTKMTIMEDSELEGSNDDDDYRQEPVGMF